MKVAQLHEYTPKQLLNPTRTPKPAHQGPKKTKMTQKLSQKLNGRIEGKQKMKVVQLHEQTPKHLSNHTRTPKPAHQGPKKTKMTQKLSQKSQQGCKWWAPNQSTKMYLSTKV